ncbi:MAG TPA: FeoB small GTPase domain-containing protein, partial [Acidimicrobiales bacterium]|nr:FeoB small GTPase domain-containing protein [Acidimicrobiales bacterium]
MTSLRPAPSRRRLLPARPAPSCHGDTGGPAAATGSPVVALVGAPNAGKSTLFNALTGASRTVGNWPGTTVEVGRGEWESTEQCCDGAARDLLDLPGAYSLDASSPDEELTARLFAGTANAPVPDLTVVVADAAHLARSLYLVAQLREADRRVVVALTMVDVAERRGVVVDAGRLATALGVPVVELDPRRRSGRDVLEQA